jgi:hypothetical protein
MPQTVEFRSNGHRASGYFVTPPTGKGPGVLVIQERRQLAMIEVRHERDEARGRQAIGHLLDAGIEPPPLVVDHDESMIAGKVTLPAKK